MGNDGLVGSPASVGRGRAGSIGNGMWRRSITGVPQRPAPLNRARLPAAQLDASQIESSSDEHLPPICERDEPLFGLAHGLLSNISSAFGAANSGSMLFYPTVFS